MIDLKKLGLHLAKGGLSFAKKTVFGLSDSMSKFTGSMAQGPVVYTRFGIPKGRDSNKE